jgi:hypothetical protein
LSIDNGYTKVRGNDWNNADNAYSLHIGFGHKFKRSGFNFGPEIFFNLKHDSQNETLNAQGETIQSKDSFSILGVGPAIKYDFQYSSFPVIFGIGCMPGVFLRKGDTKELTLSGAEVSSNSYSLKDLGVDFEGGLGFVLFPSLILKVVIHYSMIIEPREENAITWFTPAIRLYFRF